ncbi:hypothetical protein HOE67_03635 [Candidatus Peregrinibacteria bacterium]|jgi:hypothetical protein|nr:hypothetical protein [Candidatus Peregrinibacteria bacterium]MBT4056177.1 hypothetical protein [Candidatus Peregrinibacteria bacterium]
MTRADKQSDRERKPSGTLEDLYLQHGRLTDGLRVNEAALAEAKEKPFGLSRGLESIKTALIDARNLVRAQIVELLPPSPYTSTEDIAAALELDPQHRRTSVGDGPEGTHVGLDPTFNTDPDCQNHAESFLGSHFLDQLLRANTNAARGVLTFPYDLVMDDNVPGKGCGTDPTMAAASHLVNPIFIAERLASSLGKGQELEESLEAFHARIFGEGKMKGLKPAEVEA